MTVLCNHIATATSICHIAKDCRACRACRARYETGVKLAAAGAVPVHQRWCSMSQSSAETASARPTQSARAQAMTPACLVSRLKCKGALVAARWTLISDSP